MPALWQGMIGFGLVSIPVAVEPATSDHDIRFHYVHREDGGRIRNRRRCTICGRDVEHWDLAKGYERHGRHVVLTDDDLAELPLPSKKLIDVLAFIDAGQIDPVRHDRGYYLVPGPHQPDKAYVLLRDTMAAEQKAAVAKVTIGTREHLAILRVRGALLTLHTMYWPDEVRPPPRPAANVKSRPAEVQAAAELMNRMSAGYDLTAEVDNRQQALAELLAAKLEGARLPHHMTQEPEPAEVVNLMDALVASMEATKQGPTIKPPKNRRRGK